MKELPLGDDQPLLTMRDIERWGKERAQVEVEIEELQERLLIINRKLDAATLFLPPKAQEQAVPIPPTTADQVEAKSLPVAILNVLAVTNQALTNKKIRHRLQEMEPWKSRLESNDYYYTAIMRLVQRGAIVKDGKRYHLPRHKQTPDAESASGVRRRAIDLGSSQPVKPPTTR